MTPTNQERQHPLRGCAYDILGFLAGFALVAAACASNPAKAFIPYDPAPSGPFNDLLFCVAPVLVICLCWFAARRWLFLRAPASCILGFYAAAFLLAMVRTAITLAG